MFLPERKKQMAIVQNLYDSPARLPSMDARPVRDQDNKSPAPLKPCS
jgi:hypothetical protein